jgi:hypothetical protein
MNPIEYVESIKARLSTDSIIMTFAVIREYANLDEGFIRTRANLTNGDILDFSEFVRQSTTLELVSYRYQWLDKDKKLVRRWDNAPHFPTLPHFPHHFHDGKTGEVMPGKPTNIFAVLDEIAKTESPLPAGEG